MDQYKFPCSPIAVPESIVSGPQYRFTLLTPHLLRYEWSSDGIFEDRASTFAINRKFPKPDFRIQDREKQIDIISPSFHLTYDKQKFSPNGLVVTFPFKQTDWGSEWRYGTIPQGNLGGTARTLDNVEGRCDLGYGIISKEGYAALDDSDSMLFDGNGFVAGRRPGDRIDGYLFFYGYDYKGAVVSFYAVSGQQPVVPRWCLGNWWSRYYAYDHEEYLALMDKFKEHDIPLSVAVIDMDWHLVKEKEVPHAGWTGYTWNKALFPDPKAFTKALNDRGLKTTLNDHPHAGIHSHEDVYEKLAAVFKHDTTNRDPILFDPTSPEFMHAYLNVVHGDLEEQGCDFWWIDWQQGNHCRIPGLDPLWLLNHFQFLHQTRDETDSNSIVFSRYAGPGSHRYPVGFSGDTVASWGSLEFQAEFTATASNIGYGWWSHDIGGHLLGYRDDECTARWVQLGTFSPILRLHSTVSRWMSKEPWLYRSEFYQSMKRSLQQRHRIVPYIYSVNAASLKEPLVQPLYWHHPERDVAYRFPNQFYFGPTLVIAPIVTPRDKRTNLARTRVYIPPGRHVDMLTNTIYDGDQEVNMYRSLQTLPILAPEGSIIPLDRDHSPANGCANPTAFEVWVVVGRDGHFDILEDTRDDANSDGTKGSQRRIPIQYDQVAGRLVFAGAGREWSIRFTCEADLSQVTVHIDGTVFEDARCELEGSATVLIQLPATKDFDNVITIDLGADPQLPVRDPSGKIGSFLVDFQMEFKVKDEIWEIISADIPVSTKIGRLLSLGLDEALLGPLAELLLADSRSPLHK